MSWPIPAGRLGVRDALAAYRERERAGITVMHLGHLITIRTYGTWLHGDVRGSFEADGRARPPDGPLEAYERGLMRDEPMRLGCAERDVVLGAIRETCRHRGWWLLAAHVRVEHAHVVVQLDVPPERAMGSLKAWSTRRLRECGLVTPERRVWARHGSTLWLASPGEVRAAVAYAVGAQGESLAVWSQWAGS